MSTLKIKIVSNHVDKEGKAGVAAARSNAKYTD
jgi:hypothetical protein